MDSDEQNDQTQQNATVPLDTRILSADIEQADSDHDSDDEFIRSLRTQYNLDKPAPVEAPPVPTERSAKQSLADRLRQNAANAKPKKKVVFQADLSFDSNTKSNGEEPLLRVVPTKSQERELHRIELLRTYSDSLRNEMNEEGDQEIADEEFEEEEEEEDVPEIPQDVNKDIADAVIKDLKEQTTEQKEEMDEETLERHLYEKVVELRLSEDMEEIKRIIKIITGQWRSGRLRFGAEGEEGLEKAFEGNAAEKKDLAAKKRMRSQRRARRQEEYSKKLTSETITDMIERAMWIKKGTEEGASAADKIRARGAMMRENSQMKTVADRIEMKLWLKEEKLQNAQKERNELLGKHKFKKMTRSDSRGEFGQGALKFKPSDISKKQSTYSFIVKDREAKARAMPEKKGVIPKRVSTSDELTAFLTRLDNE